MFFSGAEVSSLDETGVVWVWVWEPSGASRANQLELTGLPGCLWPRRSGDRLQLGEGAELPNPSGITQSQALGPRPPGCCWFPGVPGVDAGAFPGTVQSAPSLLRTALSTLKSGWFYFQCQIIHVLGQNPGFDVGKVRPQQPGFIRKCF